MRKAWILAACAAFFWPASAAAQALTLSDVIARARDQAPRVVSARLGTVEARARMAGANVRPFNPELEGAIGRRRGSGAGTVDLDLGVFQRFEPPGRRAARVAGVAASIAQAEADLEQTTRGVILDTVSAYLRVVETSERDRLLAAAETVATALHATADRRFRAGDVAILDVNVARAGLARVRADREIGRAARVAALGELRLLLGIVGPVEIAGRVPDAPPTDLTALLQSASERPELRSLAEGVREAESSIRLGQTFRKPELGAGVRYARDEGGNILSGLFTVTLPVFSKGQELQAAGSARLARLRAELDSTRQRIEIEVRTAGAGLDRRREVVSILERDALPAVDENESLSARSYEAGQIGLTELLVIRRDSLETRFQHVNAQLQAALARVELDAAAGVLR